MEYIANVACSPKQFRFRNEVKEGDVESPSMSEVDLSDRTYANVCGLPEPAAVVT